MRPTIGLSGVNLQRLHTIVQYLEAMNTLFIIFADWNFTPDEIPVKLLDRLRDTIIVPSNTEGTCRLGQFRMLDYLVVSRALAPGAAALACHG